MPAPQLDAFTGQVPNRADPKTAGDRMDAFINWLILVFFGQFFAAVAWIQASLDSIAGSVSTATTKAQEANNAAQAAAASAASCTAQGAAVVWVSGNSYAKNAAVIGGNGKTYRRITATGISNTDPKDDAVNYILVSIGAFPQFHLQDQKASGSAGDALVVGHNTKTLNTVVGAATISGASLANNLITLPAGKYECRGFSNINTSGAAKLYLYNNTTSSILVNGCQSSGHVPIEGSFTLATASVLRLVHYVNSTNGSYGSGASSGFPEIFASIKFWKVD